MITYAMWWQVSTVITTIAIDWLVHYRREQIRRMLVISYLYDSPRRRMKTEAITGKIIRSSLFVLNNSHFMFKN